jgi:hypothetical protein
VNLSLPPFSWSIPVNDFFFPSLQTVPINLEQILGTKTQKGSCPATHISPEASKHKAFLYIGGNKKVGRTKHKSSHSSWFFYRMITNTNNSTYYTVDITQ